MPPAAPVAQRAQPAQASQGEQEGAPTVATVGAMLSVDIGSLHTRAVLFDVMGDEYRYVARATAPTTTEAPYNDVTAPSLPSAHVQPPAVLICSTCDGNTFGGRTCAPEGPQQAQE